MQLLLTSEVEIEAARTDVHHASIEYGGDLNRFNAADPTCHEKHECSRSKLLRMTLPSLIVAFAYESLNSSGCSYDCESGLLADEAVALFKQFYSRENSKGKLLRHMFYGRSTSGLRHLF